MNDLTDIPIPPLMKDRPKDRRGYPIPFFQFIPKTYQMDKKVDFRVSDPFKRPACLEKKICGLCGKPLAGEYYFIGGPLSFEHKIYSDPAMHETCARYAVKVCPYLNNAAYAVTENPIAGTVVDSMNVAGRPIVMLLVKAEDFTLTRVRDQNDKIHPMIYALAKNPIIVEQF